MKQMTERKWVSLALLVVSAIVLIPLEQKVPGYATLLLGALVAYTERQRDFFRHIILIFISVGFLGLAPISTSLDLAHIMTMVGVLMLVIGVPFAILRYRYRQKNIVTYPFKKHHFTRGHLGYILFALVVSYLILPFWMQTTGGYNNWTVERSASDLFVLFLGTNGLGIWDELFFIVTVLALLRRHVPFWVANMVQAALFTAFLYELGFTGWIAWIVYPFALSQGLVFKHTHNLWYIIVIHLTIDLVLYLALINAHHPDVLPFFITG